MDLGSNFKSSGVGLLLQLRMGVLELLQKKYAYKQDFGKASESKVPKRK